MYFVVVKLQIQYQKPARYDDQLTLLTEIIRTTPARVEHRYRLMRDNELLCEATSTVALIDGTGQLQRIPENLNEIAALE